jgi:hypothetical protein
MASHKHPKRGDRDAHPETDQPLPLTVDSVEKKEPVDTQKVSDLVEIARRNGEFSKNFDPRLGAFVYWLSLRAARPRSFLWKGLIGVGSLLGGLAFKFGLPTIG